MRAVNDEKLKMVSFPRNYMLSANIEKNIFIYFFLVFNNYLDFPRANGRKPGARVTNFVLAEFKVVARDR